MTDDIIREIDDEVRRDRYVRLLKQYSPQLTAVAALLVLVIAGVFGWRYYQQQRAAAEAAQFAAAMALEHDGKLKEAGDAFARMATEGSSGYRALGALQAAAARLQAGDNAAAVTIYDSLAADSGVERRFRDLAALLAAEHLMDSAPPDELDRRLKPLTVTDCAWRYSARELAGLVRIKAGDLAGARKAFADLADDTAAPTGVRGRAAEVLAALPAAS